MRKTNSKAKRTAISTTLGSAILGGGIIITSVAQGCGGDNPGRNTQQDIRTIVNSINELSNYTTGAGTPNLGGLAGQILNSLNSSLLPANAPTGSFFVVQDLGTIMANENLVLINPTTGNYTLAGLAINGTGVVSNDLNTFYTLLGTLNLSVNIVNGVLTVAETSGVTANNPISTIVQSVNNLSSYTTGSAVGNIISQSILQAWQTALGANFTVNSISFDTITANDVMGENNQYILNISNVIVLGTLNQDVAISFGDMSFTIAEEARMYTAVDFNVVSPSSVNTSIIGPINELSNYDGTSVPSTTLGMEFLNAITNTLVGIVETIVFQDITTANISINPNNTEIQLSFPLTGTTSAAGSPDFQGIVTVSVLINEIDGSLEIPENGVSGVSQEATGVDAIVDAVARINNYQADDPSSQNLLSLQIITTIARTTSTGQDVVIATIDPLAFFTFNSSNVQTVSSTSWRIELNTNLSDREIATISNGAFLILEQEPLILLVTDNNGIYNVDIDSSNTGITSITTNRTSGFIDALNSAVVRNYNGDTTGAGDNGLIILVGIENGFIAAASPTNIVITNWTYPPIDFFDLTVTGNNYIFLISNFAGSATSSSGNTAHTLSGNAGPNDNAIRITITVAPGSVSVTNFSGAVFL